METCAIIDDVLDSLFQNGCDPHFLGGNNEVAIPGLQ
jgi:hypothetical protein